MEATSQQKLEDKELHNSFTELGSDPELCDVEFAFAAQAEVALNEWPRVETRG